MTDRGPRRKGDSLRESSIPLASTVVDNSGGAYPTEDWEASYFGTSRRGKLTAHHLTVRAPAGLDAACPQTRIGQQGCLHGMRRWGFALRPSALVAAEFDPAPLMSTSDDGESVHTMLQSASFDPPGEFVIASPEHPFRLLAPDGTLRGSWMHWRTYLGALSFFASGGEVDADYIRFWAEAKESYRLAVDICLAALQAAPSPTR